MLAALNEYLQEADCYADLSHADGQCGAVNGYVSIHFRGSQVCGLVQQSGCAASCHHIVHAGHRAKDTEVFSLWIGGICDRRFSALAMEEYGSWRGPHLPFLLNCPLPGGSPP